MNTISSCLMSDVCYQLPVNHCSTFYSKPQADSYRISNEPPQCLDSWFLALGSWLLVLGSWL